MTVDEFEDDETARERVSLLPDGRGLDPNHQPENQPLLYFLTGLRTALPL